MVYSGDRKCLLTAQWNNNNNIVCDITCAKNYQNSTVAMLLVLEILKLWTHCYVPGKCHVDLPLLTWAKQQINLMIFTHALTVNLWHWTVHAQTDGVRFMVNRKIFVVGFGLYGSIDIPAEYSVNIQVRRFFSNSDFYQLAGCVVGAVDNTHLSAMCHCT